MPAQGGDQLVIERSGTNFRTTAAEIAALGLRSGVATINFGAFPGSNEASIAFVDTAVTADAKVHAFIASNATTSDHTANDHRYAAMLVGLSAQPSAGVGGTIYAVSQQKLQGAFAVRWSWSA